MALEAAFGWSQLTFKRFQSFGPKNGKGISTQLKCFTSIQRPFLRKCGHLTETAKVKSRPVRQLRLGETDAAQPLWAEGPFLPRRSQAWRILGKGSLRWRWEGTAPRGVTDGGTRTSGLRLPAMCWQTRSLFPEPGLCSPMSELL